MKNLSSVDLEAAKMVADSTVTKKSVSSVDLEAERAAAAATVLKGSVSSVDLEAERAAAAATVSKGSVSSVDLEARELFNLPSFECEDKTDLASQTANLKAKFGENKLGPLERAISNLKTQINSN